MALLIIFVFIALILYLLSPAEYSYSYCLLLHNLYIIYVVYLHKLDFGKEIIGYNTIFAIAFYFTNFVYPVFIFPIYPDFSLFSFSFNYNVITKSTALALLAYSCFGLGYNKIKNNATRNYKLIDNYQLFPVKILNRWKWIVILSFILFYLIGGYDMFEHTYQVAVARGSLLPRLMSILMVPVNVLATTFILRETLNSRKISWYVILGIACISLMFTGTRTLPLMILTILFYIFCNSKQLSKVAVFLFLFGGVIIMSFVGQMRGEGIDVSSLENYNLKNESSLGYWNLMSDLIINNRNLYVFYDYVQEVDYTYGLTMLSNILSPIPFLQSLFVNITGVPDYILGSATFSTFITLGTNPRLGLGTNLVGDVYLSFGLVGVIILFYLLGYFINYMRQKTFEGFYFQTIVYFALIGNCVYFCRSSYLGSLRTILWAIILGYFVVRIYKIHVK